MRNFTVPTCLFKNRFRIILIPIFILEKLHKLQVFAENTWQELISNVSLPLGESPRVKFVLSLSRLSNHG